MQWFAKKRQDKCLISLFNHIGIETGNRKESESISRIGIEIDKIQTIPNPTDMDVYRAEVTFFNFNRRDGLFFFSIIILCCIIAYCVIISVSKGSNK